MTKPFRYYLRVRYQECDSQHIVFNARYGDYVDIAISEFFRACRPNRDPFDGSFEMHVVRQLTEWKSPARFNDVIEISVAVSRFGTTSFTVLMVMRNAATGATIATCETVYVLVDGRTWAKRPLTETEKAELQAGAKGKIVDHAGHFPLRLPETV
jgi:acyl-CoA thioester hydrolase